MPTMTYDDAIVFVRWNWTDDDSKYVAARMIEKIFDKDINDVWRDVCEEPHKFEPCDAIFSIDD